MSASNRSDSEDVVSAQLKLASLNDFSLKQFLSGSFGGHSVEEFESHLSCGTSHYTPALHFFMASFPQPWAFLKVFTGALIAYLLLWGTMAQYQQSALALLPALIFVGSFVFPLAVLVLFYELNTPMNVSMVHVVKLVFLGGAVSFVFTFLLADALPILPYLYGASSAGFIEEAAKIIAVILFARMAIQSRHPWALNGVLYGAAVGTGFAALESAGYALRIGLETNSFLALNTNLLMRGILSPFTHIVWTAIAGGAFWLAYREHGNLIRAFFSLRFVTLFIISVTLHFVWNSNIDFSFFPLYLKFAILGVFAWAILLRLVATGYKELKQTVLASSHD